MRFTSEPGISTRKMTLRVRRAGRFDAPSDKAPKRPFLGGFDSSRTETRRCVLGHRKREKAATPTVGDKSTPDAPYGDTHPWHPVDIVDFVDIVDIFRKPSNNAGLRVLGSVDISWIFS